MPIRDGQVRLSERFERLVRPRREFGIESIRHHLITPGQAIKLISITDIIGFATHYADEIDWQQLYKSYPFVINTLRMLDLLVPLSDEIREKAGLKKSEVKKDIGIEYTGWPNTSFLSAKQTENGCRTLFHDSLCAPEWWLRLHYGYEERYPIWFCRYILHPLRLTAMALRWFFS